MLEPFAMPDDDPNPLIKSSVLLMALAGLISAVIISPIWILYLLIGPLWGIALVVYFFTYEKNRNPIALLLFLFLSGGAFEASVKIASLLAGGGSLFGMGSAYMSLPRLPFLFTAGSAGALIVLATGALAFGSGGLKLKTVANILFGSAGGGVLAVAAGFAGENLPFEARSRFIDFGYALVFLLWQPGVAAILGLTLNADRALAMSPDAVQPEGATTLGLTPDLDVRSATSPGAVPQHGVPRARQIAIGVAAGLCLLYVVARQAKIGFQQRQFQSQRASQFQQYVGATPPATNVSVVKSAHPEQLFVPGEISGLVYCPASLKITPHFYRERAHGFLYEARYDWARTNDAERIPCNSWLAIVVIMDVPDTAWSRFEAQYPVDLFKGPDAVEFYDPDWRYQPAVKFSQNVLKSDRQCYSWPSGHLAIELCYMAGPGNEDLLQQFLQKYPSSAFVG